MRLWAPHADRVRCQLGTTTSDLISEDGGWWRLDADVAPGTDYGFLLGTDVTPIPDSRSRWQPHGVHGLSRTYDDSAFTWRDDPWTGRHLAGSTIYELHVGTFTDAGTFDGVASKLDHLADLGIDFIELLPVNAFNGQHNWGYDGVGWYAVHEPYGGPDGLKRLVDSCHRRGIGVILDVVYNHLGPSGNYLDRFGPYLTKATNTWGRNVNLDGPGSAAVRRHIIDNALMWLRDFHIDGLRLDAVHALSDHGAVHILEELATEADALSTQLDKPLSLIAESDLNDARLITPRHAGGYGLTAQWSDDFHHALHSVLTGERQGYYADFGSLDCLATTLTKVFFHAGTWSSFRGRHHGRPVPPDTPTWRFLGYLQNHDQIGNRATGDRIGASLSPGLLAVGATLVLTAPFTPMLFMGEEWAASTPWQFFTSHPEPELAATVADGRRQEFAEHGWDTDDVPDPQDPATFERSKLRWAELAEPKHATALSLYRQLIQLRRSTPELTSGPTTMRYDEDRRWLVVYRDHIAVLCNLHRERQTIPIAGRPAELLFQTTTGSACGASEIELAGESAAVVRCDLIG